MRKIKGYYSSSDVSVMVDDVECFREYIGGMDCAKHIDGETYYEKDIVDTYVNR